MSKPSYKFIILNYLEDLRRADPEGGWIKEGFLRGIETKWGFLGFRGDRDTRELIKNGLLEAKMEGKFRIVRAKGEFFNTYRPEFIREKRLELAKIL